MLQEGKAVKWQSSAYFVSRLLPEDDLAAYMGELAIARNAGTLHAAGGPCPVIAVYRPDIRLGALLHINGGDAEVDGDNHEELIDRLLEIESEIVQGAACCYVFLDEVPAPGLMKEDHEATQIQARRQYAARVQEYLQSKGFDKVTVVFDGIGKAVELDTMSGKVVSQDDGGSVVFENDAKWNSS